MLYTSDSPMLPRTMMLLNTNPLAKYPRTVIGRD
jgi:hypothetical protein